MIPGLILFTSLVFVLGMMLGAKIEKEYHGETKD